MLSSGMMCTSARSEVAMPCRLSAFFRMVSCCRRLVWEMTRSWRAANSCDCARVTSISASVPMRTCPDYSPAAAPRWRLPAARFHVLIEAHQIPVEIERGGNGGDHLLLELQIGDFHVVLLHADVAAVHGAAEAVEQVLRDRKIEIAVGERIQAVIVAVEPIVGAGVGERALSADGQVLRVRTL